MCILLNPKGCGGCPKVTAISQRSLSDPPLDYCDCEPEKKRPWLLKFSFSEKEVNVKTIRKMAQIFVAFLEKLNFINLN